MKTVNIYTDGACRGNPGIGGWGVLIEYADIKKEYFGGMHNTTNNQMELMAAIEGLKVLKEPCQVNLTTDSKYVMQGITSWIDNWKKNNWKNAQKKEVKNKDLWIKLDFLNSNRNITWKWVKAHDINEHNNRVDLLAREAAEKLIKSSFDRV